MKKPLATMLLLSSFIFGQNTGNLITVDRIIDGDTFESKDNIVYRMIGIDTPERGEYGYKEAGAHLALTIRRHCRDEFGEYRLNSFLKRRVYIKSTGKGRYGRTLAYVSCKEKSINEIMIKDGYALSYRKYPHKYTKRYNELESEAKRYNRGLWSYWD